MPAVSKKQQKFMGAELARKRAGKKTVTGMSRKQLREFAKTKRKGLPIKKKAMGRHSSGEFEHHPSGWF